MFSCAPRATFAFGAIFVGLVLLLSFGVRKEKGYSQRWTKFTVAHCLPSPDFALVPKKSAAAVSPPLVARPLFS